MRKKHYKLCWVSQTVNTDTCANSKRNDAALVFASGTFISDEWFDTSWYARTSFTVKYSHDTWKTQICLIASIDSGIELGCGVAILSLMCCHVYMVSRDAHYPAKEEPEQWHSWAMTSLNVLLCHAWMCHYCPQNNSRPLLKVNSWHRVARTVPLVLWCCYTSLCFFWTE